MLLRALPYPKRLAKRLYFGIRHGARVHSKHVSFSSSVGRGSIIREGAIVSDCSLGRYCYLNSYVQAYRAEIGPFCSLGPSCQVGPNEHLLDNATTSEALYPESELMRVAEANREWTRLGADVWVGSAAVVLKGRTIGVGAVVAAGAIVTEDVAPYAIVAGVPAKPLRYRFDEQVRRRLLESAWWDAPAPHLRRALGGARSADSGIDPIRFLDELTRSTDDG